MDTILIKIILEDFPFRACRTHPRAQGDAYVATDRDAAPAARARAAARAGACATDGPGRTG